MQVLYHIACITTLIIRNHCCWRPWIIAGCWLRTSSQPSSDLASSLISNGWWGSIMLGNGRFQGSHLHVPTTISSGNAYDPTDICMVGGWRINHMLVLESHMGWYVVIVYVGGKGCWRSLTVPDGSSITGCHQWGVSGSSVCLHELLEPSHGQDFVKSLSCYHPWATGTPWDAKS